MLSTLGTHPAHSLATGMRYLITIGKSSFGRCSYYVRAHYVLTGEVITMMTGSFDACCAYAYAARSQANRDNDHAASRAALNAQRLNAGMDPL